MVVGHPNGGGSDPAGPDHIGTGWMEIFEYRDYSGAAVDEREDTT